MDDFKEGHLKTSEPNKYRKLYESAMRAHEAAEAHREVIREVGPDPITGRWHSQACWAGGLFRNGTSDMSGSPCWCGLQNKPEAPFEMIQELAELMGAARRQEDTRAAGRAFLNKWGVSL